MHNQSVDSELIERTLCRRTAHRILRAKFILAGKFRSFGKLPRADLTLEVALDAPKQFVHRLTVHLQTCHSNLPVKLQPNRPMRWRHLSHTRKRAPPRDTARVPPTSWAPGEFLNFVTASLREGLFSDRLRPRCLPQ